MIFLSSTVFAMRSSYQKNARPAIGECDIGRASAWTKINKRNYLLPKRYVKKNAHLILWQDVSTRMSKKF